MDLTKGSQTPFMKTWTTKCTKLGLVLFRLFLWKSKHGCAFGVSGILSLAACIGTKQWKEDKRHWQCLSLRICQEVRLFHFQEVAELAWGHLGACGNAQQRLSWLVPKAVPSAHEVLCSLDAKHKCTCSHQRLKNERWVQTWWFCGVPPL